MDKQINTKTKISAGNVPRVELIELKSGSWDYKAIGVRHIDEISEAEWAQRVAEYPKLSEAEITTAAENVDWSIRKYQDATDPGELFSASLEGILNDRA